MVFVNIKRMKYISNHAIGSYILISFFSSDNISSNNARMVMRFLMYDANLFNIETMYSLSLIRYDDSCNIFSAI